jgi:hypothetical protein
MATRSSTIDRDLGMRRIVREMTSAQNAVVTIGIQQGSINAEGTDIAEYGFTNEFGGTVTHEGIRVRIPQRSFMRTAWDENLSRINGRINTEYAQILAGNSTLFVAMRRVGLFVETAIKTKIGSNIQPANAPITIRMKGSDRTLINTNAMLNSIIYVVNINGQVNAAPQERHVQQANLPVIYDIAR